MSATIDLAHTRQNGAWFVGESDLDVLEAAARKDGHEVHRIDLAGCRGKGDLLQRIAAALEFPQTFGANWDALADCLGDLAWLPAASGHAWLFGHAGDLREHSTADFDTLCDVLDDACTRWGARNTACFAFLALPDDAFPG